MQETEEGVTLHLYWKQRKIKAYALVSFSFFNSLGNCHLKWVGLSVYHFNEPTQDNVPQAYPYVKESQAILDLIKLAIEIINWYQFDEIRLHQKNKCSFSLVLWNSLRWSFKLLPQEVHQCCGCWALKKACNRKSYAAVDSVVLCQ